MRAGTSCARRGSVALRLADEGYGPGGKNLLAEYNKMLAAQSAGRIEFLAFQSLQEMAGKPGIAEAVVFTGPPDAIWPSKIPGGAPQPEKTRFCRSPCWRASWLRASPNR